MKRDNTHRWPMAPASVFVLLAGIALTLVVGNYTSLALYDERRVVAIFTLGLLICLGVVSRANGSTLLSRGALTALAAVLLVGIASAAQAFSHWHAMLEIGTLLLLIGATLSIGAAAASTAPNLLVRPIATGCAITAVLLILVAGTISLSAITHDEPLLRPAPLDFFSNIRVFNRFATYLLPLLALPILAGNRGQRWAAPIAPFAIVGLWSLAFYSLGRGTLCAIAGAGALMPLLLGRWGLRWSLIQLAGAAAGALATALIFGPEYLPIPALGGSAENAVTLDVSGRMALWSLSFEIIAAEPWLGIGPMQFAALNEASAAAPHNLVLQLAAEWGVPAAMLLLGVLAWGALRWFRWAPRYLHSCTDSSECALIVAVSASLLAVGAHSLVSDMAKNPLSHLQLPLLLGLAVGLYRRSNPLTVQTALWTRPVARMALVVATIWVAGFTAFDLSRYDYVFYYGKDLSSGQYQQRFWLQGNLLHDMQRPWPTVGKMD